MIIERESRFKLEDYNIKTVSFNSEAGDVD